LIRSFPFSSLWFRVVLPVVTVALAALLRGWVMEDLGVRFPFVTFFYAMLLSAFIGGGFSGLLATFLSVVAVAVMVPSEELLASSPLAWFRMTIFVLTGMAFSWLSLVLQKAHAEAGEAAALRKDIAERKRIEESLRLANEQVQAASKAKSTFLANISHEIRTPLSAILGLTELCRRGRDPDKIAANLGMIEDSAKLLLAIVGDVLDLSRIEAGKLELETRAFELPIVIEKTLDAYRLTLKRKDIGQKLEVSGDTPRLLLGDPVRLGQVLGNLVGNAVKFTDSGTIFVSVSVSDRPEPGQVELHFQVTDTGIGIEPQMLGAIFDSFRQADSSFSKMHQGAGLGLAICRELTALMGGRVWVESEPGLGSTFHFTARFGLCEKDASTGAAVVAAGGQRAGPARVLVVEDNPFNLHVFEGFLREMGHQVTTATNGRQALDLLGLQTFDLVLMDVQMPEMDGVEAVRRLRQGECGEAAKALPVIALTAYAMAGDRERFLQAGMTDYLSKPVSLERLSEVVSRHAAVPEVSIPALGSLLPEAVAYLTDRLSQARALLNAGDYSGAAIAGHDIKGAAMGFALAPVLAPAAAFEGSCRAGDAALAAKHASEIEMALAVVQEGIASGSPLAVGPG
jgi:signal transduction histidine kinase/DNA-binding NarL/FixJ family response regulator